MRRRFYELAVAVPAPIPAPRSTYHYQSIRPDLSVLRKRIREIAEARARYGYRRVAKSCFGERAETGEHQTGAPAL